MTRAQALNVIKAHAAAGDIKAATRVYIENRISRAAYDAAVGAGRALGAFIAARDAQKVSA